MRLHLFALAALALPALAGPINPVSPPAAPDPDESPAEATPAVESPEPSASPTLPAGLTLSRVSHRDRAFWVAEIDLREAELQLYGQRHEFGKVSRFGELQQHLALAGRRLVWGTNAGIFTEARRPLGLQIEGGQEVRGINKADGYGNFYLKPNGIFAVHEGRARVVPTDRWTGPATFASQSGPLLLIDGALHPALREKSPNILLRSGVGTDGSHRVIFAMSDGPVRFHELATLFRDVYHCTDALYLDGVISQWVTPDRPPGKIDGSYGGLFVVSVPD